MIFGSNFKRFYEESLCLGCRDLQVRNCFVSFKYNKILKKSGDSVKFSLIFLLLCSNFLPFYIRFSTLLDGLYLKFLCLHNKGFGFNIKEYLIVAIIVLYIDSSRTFSN